MELPEECGLESSEEQSSDSTSTSGASERTLRHKDIERIRSFREAGAVERSHTIPHHGTYSNGQHSWNAASLLLCLHPDPSMALVKYVLWHDIAERWVGDAPSPAKTDSVRAQEKTILGKMGVPKLTEEEKIWASAVDKLELWCWCWDEQAFGNLHSGNVFQDLNLWFSTPGQLIPTACLEFWQRYKWKRGRELHEL